MSFASKLIETNEQWDVDTSYPDRMEALKEIKEALKGEIRLWMDEVGISGNIQVKMGLHHYSYKTPNVRLFVDYIAIWNNDYASGKWRGWLNSLSIGARKRGYRLDDKHHWEEWDANVKHNARTDPAYQGVALVESFEGRMLNLIQEMFYVFPSSNWQDAIQ